MGWRNQRRCCERFVWAPCHSNYALDRPVVIASRPSLRTLSGLALQRPEISWQTTLADDFSRRIAHRPPDKATQGRVTCGQAGMTGNARLEVVQDGTSFHFPQNSPRRHGEHSATCRPTTEGQQQWRTARKEWNHRGHSATGRPTTKGLQHWRAASKEWNHRGHGKQNQSS